MLRGDDVAELQRRLNALGFDAGREDGILGDDTTARAGRVPAQHGPPDRRHLRRRDHRASLDRRRDARRGLGRQRARTRGAPARSAPALGPAGVRRRRARVRDARPARSSTGSPTLGADAALDATGADDPVLAAEANRYAADLFLAFRPGDGPGCRCSYYASGRFRSEAGYAVADAVSERARPPSSAATPASPAAPTRCSARPAWPR